MQIGSAWTKTEEKEGKKVATGISITLDDAITEIYPQLKNVRFSLKPVEQRQTSKSPNWRLTVYKPEEKTSNTVSNNVSEEIPF